MTGRKNQRRSIDRRLITAPPPTRAAATRRSLPATPNQHLKSVAARRFAICNLKRACPAARLIDGKVISAQLKSIPKRKTARRSASCAKKTGCDARQTTFVRVGEDPASQAYVRMKGAKAGELGIRSDTIVLDEKTPQAELLELIERGSTPIRRSTAFSCMAPLPRHIKEDAIFEAPSISTGKDVDEGCSTRSMSASFCLGKIRSSSRARPPASMNC